MQRESLEAEETKAAVAATYMMEIEASEQRQDRAVMSGKFRTTV